MKARTRILAMLLTVLMVGGILPLSLFAAGSESVGSDAVQIKPADRTLAEIQTELGKVNYSLSAYQTFENWQFEGGATEYKFPVANTFASAAVNADFKIGLDDQICLKNPKGGDNGAFKVVTEADGNVALYLGSAPKVNSTEQTDNIIDFYHGLPDSFDKQAGNGSHDFYVSVDFKMGGANISQNLGDNGLLGLLYRKGNGAGASIIPTVTVSDNGVLYIGGTPDPDKLVGFLSDTEYTRIAVSISRGDNKFYVYINDILVNPEGAVLFTEELINAMNEGSLKENDVVYTAQNIPICNVRLYAVHDNTNVDVHKGLYFDNFLMGARIAVNKITTPFKDIFTSQFPTSLIGQNVSTPIPGTTVNTNGVICSGAVKFFQESDGSVAMQWHKTEGDKSSSHQAYFNIDSSKAPKGSNTRLSMDIKLGADGCLGNDNFIFYRSTVDGTKQEITVKLSSNGKLICDKVDLGTLSKDKYSNFRIDIVCNTLGGSVVALMYFDGVLKYTKSVIFNYAGNMDKGYATNEYYPNLIRVYSVYNGDNGPQILKDNDLCMKSISYTITTDYNSSSSAAPFAKTPSGLTENAGITRYYDADGKVATKDFEYAGEKYLVSYAGIIIGKESDGIKFTPYAPYSDWEHTGTLFASSLYGDLLNSKDGGSAHINATRDAFQAAANIPGLTGTARLYASYYDGGECVVTDHNSYVEWDIPDLTAASTPGENYRVNSNLVLDFDLMMAESANETDKSDESKTFFNFVCKANADGSGSRADTGFLRLDSDGWFRHEDQKLFKLSKTEFTRVSIIINTPTGDEANGTLEVYANGVKIIDGIPMNASAKYVESIRIFSHYNQSISYYVKDVALYEGTKPQQFYTAGAEEGTIELTSDATKIPVKASDVKKGFVSEDGVVRYYGENGLPTASRSGLADITGTEYKADANGVVYNFIKTEASVNTGLEYTVDFNGVQNGSFGFASLGEFEDEIFAVKFNKDYFSSGAYDMVSFDVYFPEDMVFEGQYAIALGEAQRFYKVTWLGGTSLKFGDGTYFEDNSPIPDGSVLAPFGDFTVENGRGGETHVIYYDTDDVEGMSINDTFYAGSVNYLPAILENFNTLSVGWNTINVPVIDNGDYDIDYLAFIVEKPLSQECLTSIKLSSLNLLKTSKFAINTEAADGVSADGSYYVGGIAQTGWIDVNVNTEIDAGDYYANPNTAKLVTGIYSVNGVWYEFDTDGKLIGKANGVKHAMNGFNNFGTAIYAYKMFADGAIVPGLVETETGSGVYLYTDANGVAFQNDVTVEVAGAVYGFDIDGYGKLLCANADAHVYGDAVVTKLATCKTPGEKVSTCSVCGSEKIEATETDPDIHEEYDEYGFATCCAGGAKADGVTSVYGHSIAIGKSVSIMFYLDITGNDGELEIGRRSAFIGETTEKIALSELEDVTIGDKTYKKVVIAVGPNAVDSLVMLRYVRPDGLYGSSYEYKVKDYIDATVELTPDEVFTEEIINLVKAFNEYAKNANKVVYGEGNPDKIPDTDVNESNFTSDYDVQWSSNEKNEQSGYIRLEKTFENISFSFGETLKIKVNFAITGVSSEFKFYVNGEEIKSYITENGYHAVEAEVNSCELDKEITVTVTHISGAELTLRTSAVAVAKRMYMSNNATDDEQNLMKSIYKYNAAVEAYLASLEADEDVEA